MTFSAAFIYEKLDSLAGYTKELERLLEENSDEAFLKDSGKLHVAERLVQLIVDGMIDINQHFIRELNMEMPDDMRGTFAIIGANNIVPKEFAEKIAPVTGVRNILVHQYEKLDVEHFLKNLRAHFSDFQTYQKHVLAHLKGKS